LDLRTPSGSQQNFAKLENVRLRQGFRLHFNPGVTSRRDSLPSPLTLRAKIKNDGAQIRARNRF